MLDIHRDSVIQKFEDEHKGYKLINEGDSFFVDINFNEVKGFEKLSESAKKFFEIMYKRHNAVQGLDYKVRWIPKSVVEHKTHLEVHFTGKNWLHYYANGEWG